MKPLKKKDGVLIFAFIYFGLEHVTKDIVYDEAEWGRKVSCKVIDSRLGRCFVFLNTLDTISAYRYDGDGDTKWNDKI